MAEQKDYCWESSLRSKEVPRKFTCGHCGKFAPAQQHYQAIPRDASTMSPRYIFICPNCDQPTYFESEYGPQHPGEPFGNDIPRLPPQVDLLYREARKCMTIQAYTATTLICRKILMHVAVNLGAPPNKTFTEYLDHLNNHGYLTPKNKNWVDHIRKKGNDANHTIDPIFQHEAETLITFLEMLLRLTYEFPGKMPAGKP